MTYETERGTGDNPSQFQRKLLDSEQLILSAQTMHVMKKVHNRVLDSRQNTMSEI